MKWVIDSVVSPEGRFFMGIALPKPQIDYYGIWASLYIPFISRLYCYKSKQALDCSSDPNMSQLLHPLSVF